jgi:outer membrane protein
MKRTSATALLALVLALSVSAYAQQQPAAQPQQQAPAAQQQQRTGPPPTRIGIINIQQAIVSTNEGRRDFEALQKRFEPKEAELKKMSAELEDLRRQLQTQGDKLNDEARANLARNIETRERRLRSAVEEAQSDFQAEQGEVANRIGTKLIEILDDFAHSNGFVVILDVSNPQSGVLWAAAASDVTQNVIDAYNAAHAAPQSPGATQRPAQQPRPPAAGTPR